MKINDYHKYTLYMYTVTHNIIICINFGIRYIYVMQEPRTLTVTTNISTHA